MSPFAGPLYAAAILLAVAGVAKATTPAATRVALRAAGLPAPAWLARLMGVVEVAIAAAALAVGGTVAAALVALAYLGFAGFAAVLARRSASTTPCGCFGTSAAPVGWVHVAIDLCAAALAFGATLRPPSGLTQAASATPWAGVPFYGLTALLAWMAYLSLTLLPEVHAAMKTRGAGS